MNIKRKVVQDEIGEFVDTLPELFAHDVEVYGNNAYQMWEQFHTPEGRWYSAGNNNFILFNQNVRRKTSAALPFDLERAKAGDTIETVVKGGWQTVEFIGGGGGTMIEVKYQDIPPTPHKYKFASEVQMKYPRRSQS